MNDDITSPPGGLPAGRVRLLVKAMLDHADKLRSEVHRGGLTDGSDDAYPNGYEQAARDLARAAGIEASAASPTAQPYMVEVSGPAGEPVWTDPRAALAGIDPKGPP